MCRRLPPDMPVLSAQAHQTSYAGQHIRPPSPSQLPDMGASYLDALPVDVNPSRPPLNVMDLFTQQRILASAAGEAVASKQG